MKVVSAFAALACLPAFGAVPFVTEEFTNSANATSWSIFDYDTGTISAAEWNAIDGGSDPEASTTFLTEAGVSIFASDISSNGTFTGDFVENGISEMVCDVFIEDASLIRSIEISLVIDGVAYFSDVFEPEINAWQPLEYSFKSDPWFILQDGEFVEVVLTDELLRDVEQIGIEFFPLSDEAAGQRVGVDNFTLLAPTSTPALEISSGEQIALSFFRTEGFGYTLQESADLTAESWTNLSSDTTDVTGSTEFTVLLGPLDRRFFRVLTRPIFTAVPNVSG